MSDDFYKTPLKQELLMSKIRENPSLKRIFKQQKDITEMVDYEIDHRMNGNIENFATILIYGEQGTLKSTTAQSISQKHDKTFNKSRIRFDYGEFKDAINQSQPKEWYNLDELVFTHGTGSIRVVQDIQMMIETLRKRQNSMVIVCTEPKYFDENLFTFVLETIDTKLVATCQKNQRAHEPRTCKHGCYYNNKCKIKKAVVRTAVKKGTEYLGFYIIDIDWDNNIWTEYSKQKLDFMERVKDQKVSHTDYRKIAEEILTDPENEKYQNNKQLKLLLYMKKPQLTVGETELIIEQIKMIRKK